MPECKFMNEEGQKQIKLNLSEKKKKLFLGF
jgi:hypothetical protein